MHLTYLLHFLVRFLIEYMRLEGLYLLYPNFPEQASFSTNHREEGVHSGRRSKLILNCTATPMLPECAEERGALARTSIRKNPLHLAHFSSFPERPLLGRRNGKYTVRLTIDDPFTPPGESPCALVMKERERLRVVDLYHERVEGLHALSLPSSDIRRFLGMSE